MPPWQPSEGEKRLWLWAVALVITLYLYDLALIGLLLRWWRVIP